MISAMFAVAMILPQPTSAQSIPLWSEKRWVAYFGHEDFRDPSIEKALKPFTRHFRPYPHGTPPLESLKPYNKNIVPYLMKLAGQKGFGFGRHDPLPGITHPHWPFVRDALRSIRDEGAIPDLKRIMYDSMFGVDALFALTAMKAKLSAEEKKELSLRRIKLPSEP